MASEAVLRPPLKVKEGGNFGGQTISTKLHIDPDFVNRSDFGFGLRGRLEAAAIFDLLKVKEGGIFRGRTIKTKLHVDPNLVQNSDLGIGLRGRFEAAAIFNLLKVKKREFWKSSH